MPKKISPSDFTSTNGQKKRKGIHAKTKHSQHKSSANYKKAYKGQGR